MPEELAYKTAMELAACYRDGSLSPVEAARATLERIAHHQESLNAYCLVDEEAALADARQFLAKNALIFGLFPKERRIRNWRKYCRRISMKEVEI